jgi:hypothetical protein
MITNREMIDIFAAITDNSNLLINTDSDDHVFTLNNKIIEKHKRVYRVWLLPFIAYRYMLENVLR